MSDDWIACDGKGNGAGPRDRGWTRRQVLLGSGLAALGLAGTGGGALAQMAFRADPERRDGPALVVVFLRGGADGLNIVPPYGEDAYHRLRPTIGLGVPRSGGTLDLDGFFGLHPALGGLLPHYQEGRMAVVHACGSGDRTRSHFEAMATMERGVASESDGTASGWLGRYLATTYERSDSPLRAIAFGAVMPDALRGATNASAVTSLDDFRLSLPKSRSAERQAALRQTLTAFYSDGVDAVSAAGRDTLSVIDALGRIDSRRATPARGHAYPQSELGRGLQQVATLLRARVGLEIACLDRGGWDTHVAQGGQTGWLAMQLKDVGDSLAAFAADLGPEMERITVVVQTEFGRRAQENSGLGTDHGRASVLFLLGGGVAGGKVYARWPGLEQGQLEPPGDLKVTTDYRDVLAEVVRKRLGHPDASAVFPRHQVSPVDIIKGA